MLTCAHLLPHEFLTRYGTILNAVALVPIYAYQSAHKKVEHMNDLPFGFTPNEGQPFDMNSLGEMLQQIGQMMQRAQNDTTENGVSWGTIHDSARQAISAAGDPSITDKQKNDVSQAVALAQVWLDGVTTYPASSTESLAWSRSEWLEATLPAWRPLIEPVAAGLSRTVTQISSEAQSPQELEQLPPEMKAMLEPM
ncbi:MAG: hypothetical protein RIS43_931, partial [Actinomycetota bacterium]